MAKTKAKKKTTKKKTSSVSKKKTAKPISVFEIDVEPPRPKSNLVGSWAFVIGFIVAIITGIASIFPDADVRLLKFILIMCGVVIGFLNIRDHEAKEFMIAGALLVIMSWLGLTTISSISIYENILYALQQLFIPATIIVALRTLFVLGHK